MDVRCDRCETEYELDDAIVTDTGASVQCTTCGHTFVVTRQGTSAPAPAPAKQSGATPPAGTAEGSGPDVPEWTLSTDDGKVHRFRELNVLQKWIVERKVTRTDRISRRGGPWLSLGDVIELTPFFSVVDEADRARAAIPTPPSAFASSGSPSASLRPPPGMIPPSASRGSGAARPNGASSSPSASSPPAPPPQAGGRVSEDGPTVPNRRLSGSLASASAAPSTPAAQAPSRRAEPQPGIRPPDDQTPTASMNVAAARANAAAPRASARTELVFGPGSTAEARLLDSDLLEQSHAGRNVAIAVVLMLLAGGGVGAWWYTQKGPGAGTTTTTAATTGTVPGAPTRAPVKPAPAGPAQGTPQATTESKNNKAADAKPAPSGEAKTAVAAAGGGEGAAGDANTAQVTGAVRGRGVAKAGRAVADAGAAAPSHAGSYDLLVREADRLLDAGKSAKADKLYAQALAVRPEGVAALTGSAYVLLDRQRHFKAIETFRRALAAQPGYGPALFGIAESYRARGDTAQALGAYRQYLAVAPTGTDAPAARRQIKDLESATPPPSTAERPATAAPAPPADP